MGDPAHKPPLLLAMDTATAYASVALFDGQRVLAETTWLAGRGHSSALVVAIDRVLGEAGGKPDELTGVAVTHGPGSFTGVRVALSVAKGIAAGLGIPVWGVGTLDVLAHAAQGAEAAVRPVLEMGRGRYATALFRDGAIGEVVGNVTADALRDLTREPVVVVGDLPSEVRRALADTPARLLSPAASLRRAGLVAELGWRAALAGDPGDPAALDAVYLSKS